VAAEVGIGRVLIPPAPGHFSAIGMLQANLRFDRREVFRQRLDSVDISALNQVVTRISNELASLVGQSTGISGGKLRFSYGVAIRYKGQEHALMIPVAVRDPQAMDFDADLVRRFFHQEYLLRYGHNHEGAVVLIEEIEVVAERELPIPALKNRLKPNSAEVGVIDAYFTQVNNSIRTPIVYRGALEKGAKFEGPVIIYEDGSNTVVPPGAKGNVLEAGQLMIDVTGIAQTDK
jgi:N-methylhydantoinase A